MEERKWIKFCDGRVEIPEDSLERYYFEDGKKFIAAYRSVYQIFYSVNAGWYTQKVGYFPKDYGRHYVPITKRGQYTIGDAEWINKLVGCDNWLVD